MGTAFGSGRNISMGDDMRDSVSLGMGEFVRVGLIAVEVGRGGKLVKAALEVGDIGTWDGLQPEITSRIPANTIHPAHWAGILLELVFIDNNLSSSPFIRFQFSDY